MIKQFLHDHLDYGYPTEMTEKDSFQPVYGCELCDGRLAQDSTGAYFHLASKV